MNNVRKNPKSEFQLYHCGIVPDGPANNVTIAGAITPDPADPENLRRNTYGRAVNFPLETRRYRDDNDQDGTLLFGAVNKLRQEDYEAALKGIDRRVVIWYPIPKDEREKTRGVGPGGNFWSARIWDKDAPGYNDNVDPEGNALVEPLARYLYMMPILSRDQQFAGPAPTIEAMRDGRGEAQVMGEIEHLKKMLEQKEAAAKLLAVQHEEEGSKKQGARR